MEKNIKQSIALKKLPLLRSRGGIEMHQKDRQKNCHKKCLQNDLPKMAQFNKKIGG